MTTSPIRLGVNVDHVATVRNARGGEHPDPVHAALVAIEAGADGITAHLREDRRHINDEDVERLKASIAKPLNLEMAVTDEMIGIASKLQPAAACLVPEKRSERTTEGGLDVDGQRSRLASAVSELKRAGIVVSLFIEPERTQIEAAAAVGAPAIEIHTGAWCIARKRGLASEIPEWRRICDAARSALGLGLEVHVGHGLDYAAAEAISGVPEIVELNIGHFLIGEAIYDGLPAAVKKMRTAMECGRRNLGVHALRTAF